MTELTGTVHHCPVHGDTTDPLWLGPAEEAFPYCPDEDCTERLELVRGGWHDLPKLSEWTRSNSEIVQGKPRRGRPKKTRDASPVPAGGEQAEPCAAPQTGASRSGDDAVSAAPAAAAPAEPRAHTVAGAVLALLRSGLTAPRDIRSALSGGPHAATAKHADQHLQYLKRRGLVESAGPGQWRAIR